MEMTEREYYKQKLKLMLGGKSIRQFYNQTLKSLNSLENALEETPSLEDELMPQIKRKSIILGALIKYIRQEVKYDISEEEILGGFKL